MIAGRLLTTVRVRSFLALLAAAGLTACGGKTGAADGGFEDAGPCVQKTTAEYCQEASATCGTIHVGCGNDQVGVLCGVCAANMYCEMNATGASCLCNPNPTVGQPPCTNGADGG